MTSRKTSRQAARAKAKQEQVERGLLELFRVNHNPYIWQGLASNISASSQALETAIKALEGRGLIGHKTIQVGMGGRKSVTAWFLSEKGKSDT